MEPLVSVILPTYNMASSLGASLISLLGQSYSNFELIIIDDCSTDDTAEVINSFSDSRIKVIRNNLNLGIFKSCNKAIQAAKGKYIARSDADDVNMPTRLQVQVAFLEGHPDVDVVGTNYYVFSNEGKIIGERIIKYTEHEDLIRKIEWFSPPLADPTLMGKANWFKHYMYRGKFDRGGDADLFLRSYCKSKFANIPKLLYAYNDAGTPAFNKLARSSFKTLYAYWEHWRENAVSIPILFGHPLLLVTRWIHYFIAWACGRGIMWAHVKKTLSQEAVALDQEWITHCLDSGIR